LKVYRFVSLQFPDGLSCEGARRNGGRWNSKGVAVLYCATSESLAMLELRVHSPHPYPRTRWKFVIEVPADALTSIAGEELPRGWDNLPPGPQSKRVGDAWVAANSGLGLLVPSVVASEEKNLVLNPSHRRFQEVRVLSKRRVMLDKRLYTIPAKREPGSQRKRKK
jgi:RES domain-containing protein